MGLGQLEDLAPGSPARFNLLFAEPGTYTVRLIEADRPIGRIIVDAPLRRPRGRARSARCGGAGVAALVDREADDARGQL